MESVIQILKDAKAKFEATKRSWSNNALTVMFDNGLTVKEVEEKMIICSTAEPETFTLNYCKSLQRRIKNGNGEGLIIVTIKQFCERNIELINESLELVYSEKAKKIIASNGN